MKDGEHRAGGEADRAHQPEIERLLAGHVSDVEDMIRVKADNVEIPCAGIAVGDGAVAHDETVGDTAVAASARIVEAAGVRAADGVILIDKLVKIQSVIVRAVSVQRADNDL